MKRRSFLQSAMAVPLAALPAAAQATPKPKTGLAKGFKVAAGQDRFGASITVMEGDTFFTKVATSDSNGDMFLFESKRLVNGGPPLHYHPSQDEWFYILEGEFDFKIGDESFTAVAGDSLYGPRNIPHAFAKTNAGIARMMILYQPAGKMEQFFKAVSEGKLLKLSAPEQQKFREEHGFVVVGPALGHEKK